MRTVAGMRPRARLRCDAVSIIGAINEQVWGRNTWPPPGMGRRWEEIELFAALRDSDDDRLRQEASVSWQAPYVLNPLARMVSRASANLLFGEPATFTPGDQQDSDLLGDLVMANDLDSELMRAALISSSEGEVWGRIVVAPALLDYPIIEWCSGSHVIPHFRGRFVTGATFVTSWQTGNTEVHRLLEHYEPGVIRSQLYRGTRGRIGTEVNLERFGPTEQTPAEVFTGIEAPLVAFIPNSLGVDPTRGVSDYRGLEQRFLALNEAVTVGQQNLKLAGRKRALVDAEYLDVNGQLPDGDDVYVRQDRDSTLGEAGKPLQMIDYSYDSAAVTAWIEHLIDTTLTFAGVAPQSVGRSVDGGAVSGTAMKLKMSHSLMEAAGKGRAFDRGLRRLLKFAAVLDSRPTTEGGFGRRWTAPDSEPTVNRSDGLLRDDKEAAEVLTTLINAEVVSQEEAVRWWNPEWTEDQVRDELARIAGDTPGGTDPAGAGAPGAPAGGTTISTPRPPLNV